MPVFAWFSRLSRSIELAWVGDVAGARYAWQRGGTQTYMTVLGMRDPGPPMPPAVPRPLAVAAFAAPPLPGFEGAPPPPLPTAAVPPLAASTDKLPPGDMLPLAPQPAAAAAVSPAPPQTQQAAPGSSATLLTHHPGRGAPPHAKNKKKKK